MWWKLREYTFTRQIVIPAKIRVMFLFVFSIHFKQNVPNLSENIRSFASKMPIFGTDTFLAKAILLRIPEFSTQSINA